jgi:hypothetical protein
MNLSGLNSSKIPASERLSARTAEAVVDRWHQAQPALERERLQRLRRVGERDAASQFAQLLQLRPPYPLRPTSGLVEKQRILARLCKQS